MYSIGLETLHDMCMELYANGTGIIAPISEKILYNCCHSDAIMLKLEHNSKGFLIEVKTDTGEEIAKEVIRPTKVVPASGVIARCV